jgi:hypothetical protein
MIYEFALEPELVARWHDRGEYAFFRGCFGLKEGRIISGYPKKWRKMVRKAFFEQYPGGNQNAEMRLEALLDELCNKMVKRNNSFNEIPTWLEKAELEHEERPFRCILGTDNPREKVFVVTNTELTTGSITDEKWSNYWEIPPASSPSRDADEYARIAAPILRCCQQAIFVDPHFDPNPFRPRFLNTLEKMLAILWNQNHNMETPLAELHIDGEKRGERYILQKCNEHLPTVIPYGKKLRVVLWKNRVGGERLHNRYLLTDIGSICFGVGLDEADTANHGESDDLLLLSVDQQSKRWNQYAGGMGFDLVCDPIEVIGE